MLAPVACEDLDLAPVGCAPYPPSGVLLCAPDVICGQWRVGQVTTVDDTGWGPVTCSPLAPVASASAPLVLATAVTASLDLDPLVCVEA